MEANPPESEAESHVLIDLAQVCVVDGIWQDEPDHLAAFDAARLGAPARGNLYLMFDVSGGAEGRGEFARESVETLRREYAGHRGSITFGLSEALRAANARLYEMNLAAAREERRMAGVAAAVLRGADLYLALAGPAVAYVETCGKMQRYPAESDWFTEDQPLLDPQRNASLPLGVQREFACDLFHTAVAAGDVFVLASRALTQLATTEELARAFAERGAEDIADYVEDLAAGADLSALVAELVDSRDAAQSQASGRPAPAAADEREFTAAALPETAAPEFMIDWDTPPPPTTAPPPGLPEAAEAAESPEQVLERRREERRRRREAQLGGIARTAGRIAGGILAVAAWLGALVGRAFRAVDWAALNASLNRVLNMLFLAAWHLLTLAVRLILPGAPARQPALIPRRASQEPVWLRAVAVLLPVVFAGLAFGIYKQQDLKLGTQATDLVQQASRLEQASESNTDNNAARQQLTQALALIRQARQTRDSAQARGVFYRIQDQLNERDGIVVLYYLPAIAEFQDSTARLTQVLAAGSDVYILDRGGARVYHYTVNDSATQAQPASGDGVILKSGDKVNNVTVDQIRDIVWVDAKDASSKPALVAVTGRAFFQLNPPDTTWRATPAADAAQWGDVRAVASFSGNLYLLDAAKDQIWKYVPAANGYTAPAQPYLPANSGMDFSHAVDMSIDGDIWILNGDGSVLHLANRQAQAFAFSGLAVPLKNPVALFTRPGVDSLYVADAGNARIVEFDKTGQFVRQFKPRAQDGTVFDSLQALFASETARKFFFISGNTVYAANVPK